MNSTPTSGFELPDRYEKDMLQLLVRDAHTLYVYWEIGNRKRWLCSQHFECDYGQLPKVLRVYDVTTIYFNGSNANGYMDIVTSPEANNWYIHGARADTSYIIDLGVTTFEGQFIPLLRSNSVVTPRDGTAPWGAPLQPTVAEARAVGRAASLRIMPHDFENFNAYSNCMK